MNDALTGRAASHMNLYSLCAGRTGSFSIIRANSDAWGSWFNGGGTHGFVTDDPGTDGGSGCGYVKS